MKITKHNTTGGKKEGFRVVKIQEIKGESIKRINDGSDTEAEVGDLKCKNAYSPSKVKRTCKSKQSNVLDERKESKTKKLSCMDYQDISDDDDEAIHKLDNGDNNIKGMLFINYLFSLITHIVKIHFSIKHNLYVIYRCQQIFKHVVLA